MRQAALLSLVTLLLASSALAADDPNLRTVSTAGESVVYVRPDEAVVGFGVESFAPSLEKAKQDNQDASNRLIAAVKGLGVEDRYIQTDAVQVEIRYNEGNHPVRGIEGYYARRAYSVTLKDIKLLDRFIDTVLKNGANQLSGFEYRSSELRKHRDAARKLAVTAAREKAEALATELGCKVGFPRTISEGGIGYFNNEFRWGGNSFQAQNVAQVAPGGAEGGDAATPLGQIGIRANVSVVFDLIPTGDKPERAEKAAPADTPAAKPASR